MESKENMLKKFAALGVAEADAFREIVRARYLDAEIFKVPKYSEYGISQEDFFRLAKELTEESLGPVPGNEELYGYIYSAAMSVDPMEYADVPRASEILAAVVHHAVQSAAAHKKILFAGAERYLALLTNIFVALKGRDITVTVADEEWRKPLSMIYTKGRWVSPETLAAEEETYDFIFLAAETGAEWRRIAGKLSGNGVMEALLPDAALSETGAAEDERKREAESCRVSFLYHVVDGEREEEFFSYGKAEPAGDIAIGEAGAVDGCFHGDVKLSMTRQNFAAAESWDYDLYAWNGSPALQTILSAGLLDPDFAAAGAFRAVTAMAGTRGAYPFVSAEAVTDAGVRLDLVVEKETENVKRIEAGDLLVCVKQGEVVTAVVPALLKEAAAAEEIIALRPIGNYTAEYLKAYLDGPLGQLFIKTMKAREEVHLSAARLLRVPIKKVESEGTMADITARVREATEALMEKETEWRRVKLDAVNLMMKEQAGK